MSGLDRMVAVDVGTLAVLRWLEEGRRLKLHQWIGQSSNKFENPHSRDTQK